METSQLDRMLEENKINLEKFLQVLSEQQKHLVDNNISGLEQSIIKEEKLINQIEEVKFKTAEALSNLIEEYSIKVNGSRLKDFISAVKNKINIDETIILQKKIFDLANQVKQMNNQNKVLIEHARSFIKATVKALSTDNSLVLDRKV